MAEEQTRETIDIRPDRMESQEQKIENPENTSYLKGGSTRFRMIGTVNPRGANFPWSYSASPGTYLYVYVHTLVMSHESQDSSYHHIPICAALAGQARLDPLPLPHQGLDIVSTGQVLYKRGLMPGEKQKLISHNSAFDWCM